MDKTENWEDVSASLGKSFNFIIFLAVLSVICPSYTVHQDDWHSHGILTTTAYPFCKHSAASFIPHLLSSSLPCLSSSAVLSPVLPAESQHPYPYSHTFTWSLSRTQGQQDHCEQDHEHLGGGSRLSPKPVVEEARQLAAFIRRSRIMAPLNSIPRYFLLNKAGNLASLTPHWDFCPAG